MSRIKRAVQARKHRKNVLKQTKGFKYGRKSKFKLAKDALKHALTYAYRDRKVKKRLNRGFQNIRINALSRENGMTYSRFINALKRNKIELDRKVLAELANEHPKVFIKVLEEVK